MIDSYKNDSYIVDIKKEIQIIQRHVMTCKGLLCWLVR